MNKLINGLIVIVMTLVLCGCATIVGDATHTMPVGSSPDGAMIEITDEKGKEIYKGQTPTTVSLEKSDGSYWGGKKYTIKLSKDGFETQSVEVKATPNGWYIAGNFVFGGLIGWFIVDPLNGKMYNLSPKEINATLAQKSAGDANDRDGAVTLKFVLLRDLPEALRSKMTAID